MRRSIAVPAVLLMMAAAGLTVLPGASAAEQAGPAVARYLVQLSGEPLATYDGGVPGIPATRPGEGARLDGRTAAAGEYRAYLGEQRATVLRASGVTAGATMDTAFNGFAAELTAADVSRLRATDGVAAVLPDRRVTIHTSNTSSYLGLSGRTGLWKTGKNTGEGVVIGVIDTGYWPESPSFAALPEPRPDRRIIDAKWHGVCDFGDEKPLCNNKVIGARWYDNDGMGDLYDGEFHSPRDSNGHGTHTASTAAGLSGVPAKLDGLDLGRITGMAPGARLAIYKALWSDGAGGAYGSGADLVNAIDDAVSDGVDVINYSVGDGSEVFNAIDEAFFNAAAAGVFVSASAGNSGPDDSTVDNTLPWVTTVAATEQDHRFLKNITLGNGMKLSGVGLGAGTKRVSLIDAADAVADDADGGTRLDAPYCLPDRLDPAKVRGRVVLCARGDNGRVAKGEVLAALGAAGMILYQPVWDPNGLMADRHVLPAVHVDVDTGTALRAYAKEENPTVTLGTGRWTAVTWPAVGGFSSAGPSLLTGADLLKPDLAAPGVDVVAAVSPAESGDTVALMSGTSMAAPHIAGIAALVRSAHPGWTPDMVKSALMTSASAVTNRGGTIQKAGEDANALDYGAGEVRPSGALDPGLVFGNDAGDWMDFLCGVAADPAGHVGLDGLAACEGHATIAAADLNYPSVSFGTMLGTRTTTRTVTNVGRKTSRYTVDIDAPDGYRVTVNPKTLTIRPGASATVTITVSHAGGAFDTWVEGGLTWRDTQGHRVRIPLMVRNTEIEAPYDVNTTATSGTQTVSVRAGWQGTLVAKASGLTAGTTAAGTIVGDSSDHVWDETDLANLPSPLPGSMLTAPIHVPDGSAGSQVRIAAQYGDCLAPAAEQATPCGYYLPWFFEATTGERVGVGAFSRDGTAMFDLPDGGGDYVMVIDQHQLRDGAGQDFTWTVYTPGAPGTGSGTLSVSPDRVALAAGSTVDLTVTWADAEPGRRHQGVIEVGDGTTVHRRIRVNVLG
ncbi:S8 family peptidase [Actinoplanes rectilineatus]|uniref:S8 family peptidase n=1 Tax=Actinoplanes rectilineatus TaxID=113571 RepID=UPI0012FC9115|nr:S8 family peptidase [Actinoplanes rectilineatus]